ncbi:hypothetical protein CMUS01_04396 [Colletotrichum musicola]|uniref:Uncharacterized protein n=1 Tax=Colletotrichum musicola TaxID=2175873 RepID=A0A8H6KWJ3_9PEZI|nr:hypothetical protein CMUS01_04396 [Colletotrichum musicola]
MPVLPTAVIDAKPHGVVVQQCFEVQQRYSQSRELTTVNIGRSRTTAQTFLECVASPQERQPRDKPYFFV